MGEGLQPSLGPVSALPEVGLRKHSHSFCELNTTGKFKTDWICLFRDADPLSCWSLVKEGRQPLPLQGQEGGAATLDLYD